MKHLRKSPLTGVLLAVLIGLGFTWSQGQTGNVERASAPAGASPGDPSSDKWAQIEGNNKKMLENLQVIEENLEFAKKRAMQAR